MKSLEELLRPPSEEEVVTALRRFAADVRRQYDDRLKSLHLFGSRARGDHGPESDADVAVILRDDGWRFWDEKMNLVDIAYYAGMENSLYIQPWPFTDSEWNDPSRSARAKLIHSARRDAVDLP